MSFRDNYKLINWSDLPPDVPKVRTPPARSDLPCPMLISDAMAPTQSMADGRIYESKSAIEAATRRAGCTTVGNDKRPAFQRPKTSRAQLKQAVEKATARFERGERAAS